MISKSDILYKNLQKRYSRKINLNLNRIQKVLLKMDCPHLELSNPINIIGSDGKMSTLTSLKYFLENQRKNLTAFTSPHLLDVRERFWLKNRFIKIEEMKKYIKNIENTKLKLTLFELLTCIYILAAKNQKKINYNLVEAGLLFKKDSTNLWTHPRAQIVTNINFQHQDWIKPKTLNEICNQKLSSLSQNTTIYVGRQKPRTLKIIKKILNKNKSKKVYASNWSIKKVKNHYIYKDHNVTIPIKSRLINSEGLIQNLGLSIRVALDLGVSKKTIIRTIPKIKFEGRMQYLRKGNLKKMLSRNENLLIDGCHSIESAKNLYNYLKTLKEPIYGIWGMQKNKLPDSFIKIFKKIFTKVFTITIPKEKNSIKSQELKKISQKYNNKTFESLNFKSALKKISSNKKKTIVIFGSLYLVGKVLREN